MNKKLIITVIVLAISVATVWYFGMRGETNINKALTAEELQELNVPELIEPDQQTQNLIEQGDSDELNAIQSDVNNTDLNGLDKELSDIEDTLNF